MVVVETAGTSRGEISPPDRQQGEKKPRPALDQPFRRPRDYAMLIQNIRLRMPVPSPLPTGSPSGQPPGNTRRRRQGVAEPRCTSVERKKGERSMRKGGEEPPHKAKSFPPLRMESSCACTDETTWSPVLQERVLLRRYPETPSKPRPSSRREIDAGSGTLW